MRTSETVRETQVRETTSVSVIKRTRPSERENKRQGQNECERVSASEKQGERVRDRGGDKQ